MLADIFVGLDVISPSAWSALPDDYFGRDLQSEAELVAVGYVDLATHSVLHTVGGDTFLRGSSTDFHLCRFIFLSKLLTLELLPVFLRSLGIFWMMSSYQQRYAKLWASYQIRKIAGCTCAGNAGNVFPAFHWLQRKPSVSDPGMHHGTCVTHVPWCMSGLLTRGGGENGPSNPGACESRNFT